MPVFDRGDIVRMRLNPTSGKELQGDMRPCLVMSPKAFNQLGLTYVAPITQGGNQARFKGFAVSLMGTGTETQGVIMMNSIRSVDLLARQARKVEAVPEYILEECIAIFEAIIQG